MLKNRPRTTPTGFTEGPKTTPYIVVIVISEVIQGKNVMAWKKPCSPIPRPSSMVTVSE